MSGGLTTTWQHLTKTRNGVALDVLLPLLDSRNSDLVLRCVTALLRRRDSAGHQAVLARVHRFDEATRAAMAELPGRMTPALRNAVVGSDQHLFDNALTAIRLMREYDLIPTLTLAAEGEGARHDSAAATIVSLAKLLHEELAGTLRPVDHRDPERYRGLALGSVVESLGRFPNHRRSEIVESFLLLTPRNSKTLGQILEAPPHACQGAILKQLETSSDPQLVGQLLSIALRPGAPRAVVEMLGTRDDLPFVQHLLTSVDSGKIDSLRRTLKQLEHIAWIAADREILQRLDGPQSEVAVAFVLASGVRRTDAFEFLRNLLRWGQPDARRAACAGLVGFSGGAANDLVLQALSDECPTVQAEAARQLRPRGIPGALSRLVGLLDSPHAVVQEAARQSLSEFSFDRYRAAFDFLANESRVTAGEIVKKVDVTLPEELRRDLLSMARARRLRAIEMTTASGTAQSVERELINNLEDEDHLVRAAAALALGQSGSDASRAALRTALADRSVVVQLAARESLATLHHTRGPVRPYSGAKP